jgi:putative SOS response-associated peptidase YedK
MCGRVVASRPVEDIAALLEVDDIEVPEELISPRWNVAPTDGVLAVATRAQRDSGEQRRRLTDYRWGLVPSWSKDPGSGARAFNARAETLLERPAFRTAVAKRRCLIPADAFYEWEKIAAADGRKPRRQPWCFVAAHGGVLAFAGLWEVWKPKGDGDPSGAGGPSGAGWHDQWLLSCTIITTTANELVEPLHDRMPVILQPEDWSAWLDPGELEAAELGSLLTPAPVELLHSYPVSPAVNSNRADGPELVEPLVEHGDEDVPGEEGGGQLRLLPLR